MAHAAADDDDDDDVLICEVDCDDNELREMLQKVACKDENTHEAPEEPTTPTVPDEEMDHVISNDVYWRHANDLGEVGDSTFPETQLESVPALAAAAKPIRPSVAPRLRSKPSTAPEPRSQEPKPSSVPKPKTSTDPSGSKPNSVPEPKTSTDPQGSKPSSVPEPKTSTDPQGTKPSSVPEPKTSTDPQGGLKPSSDEPKSGKAEVAKTTNRAPKTPRTKKTFSSPGSESKSASAADTPADKFNARMEVMIKQKKEGKVEIVSGFYTEEKMKDRVKAVREYCLASRERRKTLVRRDKYQKQIREFWVDVQTSGTLATTNTEEFSFCFEIIDPTCELPGPVLGKEPMPAYDGTLGEDDETTEEEDNEEDGPDSKEEVTPSKTGKRRFNQKTAA
ncbi:unnamed protein product [Symbiodinium necroappetens]|uniref:Uncharacterized protein n=1 Tax=Symbiodinium necroappetens TaxID=1628268 RepID=A0A812WQ71_9DINO|nr:unnamed protein product [Symbiodinium necroappetens]